MTWKMNHKVSVPRKVPPRCEMCTSGSDPQAYSFATSQISTKTSFEKNLTSGSNQCKQCLNTRDSMYTITQRAWRIHWGYLHNAWTRTERNTCSFEHTLEERTTVLLSRETWDMDLGTPQGSDANGYGSWTSKIRQILRKANVTTGSRESCC